MLVHLLRSHPDIISHDEVFSPGKVGGMTGTYLIEAPCGTGFCRPYGCGEGTAIRSSSSTRSCLISREKGCLL